MPAREVAGHQAASEDGVYVAEAGGADKEVFSYWGGDGDGGKGVGVYEGVEDLGFHYFWEGCGFWGGRWSLLWIRFWGVASMSRTLAELWSAGEDAEF